jgi:hypothetical protein
MAAARPRPRPSRRRWSCRRRHRRRRRALGWHRRRATRANSGPSSMTRLEADARRVAERGIARRPSARLDDDDESDGVCESRAPGARSSRRRRDEWHRRTGVPVVAAPASQARKHHARRSAPSSRRRVAVLPPEARRTRRSTLVGLESVPVNSQQTLSAVSDVTPASTSDSSTHASPPSTPSLDPSHRPERARARRADPHRRGARRRPLPAPMRRRRTLIDEQTRTAWVYVAIGAGARCSSSTLVHLDSAELIRW